MNKLEYQLHRPVMQILAPVTVLAFFIICRLNIDSFYIFRRFFTGRSSYEALLDDAGEVGILFRLFEQWLCKYDHENYRDDKP